MPIMLFVFAQKFGALAAKHGSRWIIFAGAVVCVVGQLMMLQVKNPDSYSDIVSITTAAPARSDSKSFKLANRLDLYGNGVYTITSECRDSTDPTVICSSPSLLSVVQVVLAAFVIGFGLAMLVAPLTSVVLSSLPAKNAGVGTAVNYVAAKVAGLFAVAGLGLVFSSVFTASLNSRLSQISPDPSLKAKLEAFKSNPSARAEPGLPLVRGAQTEAFKRVMLVCAGLTLVGGVAALFVRDDLLPESDPKLT
jgi:MFS family permease